jgi:hypothetical protein
MIKTTVDNLNKMKTDSYFIKIKTNVSNQEMVLLADYCCC